MSPKSELREIKLEGIGSSPGISIGKAYLVDREGVEVVKQYFVDEKGIETEKKRFRNAVKKTT